MTRGGCRRAVERRKSRNQKTRRSCSAGDTRRRRRWRRSFSSSVGSRGVTLGAFTGAGSAGRRTTLLTSKTPDEGCPLAACVADGRAGLAVLSGSGSCIRGAYRRSTSHSPSYNQSKRSRRTAAMARQIRGPDARKATTRSAFPRSFRSVLGLITIVDRNQWLGQFFLEPKSSCESS